MKLLYLIANQTKIKAMIEINTAIHIFAPQKGSADAAGSAMVEARAGFIDDIFTGSGHGGLFLLFSPVLLKSDHQGGRISYFCCEIMAAGLVLNRQPVR